MHQVMLIESFGKVWPCWSHKPCPNVASLYLWASLNYYLDTLEMGKAADLPNFSSISWLLRKPTTQKTSRNQCLDSSPTPSYPRAQLRRHLSPETPEWRHDNSEGALWWWTAICKTWTLCWVYHCWLHPHSTVAKMGNKRTVNTLTLSVWVLGIWKWVRYGYVVKESVV